MLKDLSKTSFVNDVDDEEEEEDDDVDEVCASYEWMK
jgi:hypothetical protein